MVDQRLQRGFTITELLVVIAVIGLLLAVIVPTINARREAARRKMCQERIKQIVLALANHESAYDRYPLVFNAPSDLAVGNAPQAFLAAPAGTGTAHSPGKMTGWSWMVRIVPYFCEGNIFKNIDVATNQFSVLPSNDGMFSAPTGPFDKAISNGAATYQHCSCIPLEEFICPSWSGNANTHDANTVDATPSGAQEYAKLRSLLPSIGAPNGFVDLPAPTNYKAIVGTHLQTSGKYKYAPVENGFMSLSGKHGLEAKEITDGLSVTIAVAETRECGYASWYDGTMNWLVTNDPNAASSPGVNDSPPWTGGQSAINRGYDPSRAASSVNTPYLPRALSINGIDGNENWGPSSEHTNGVVMHAYPDCHVAEITEKCDPQIYLDMTTRSGNERPDLSQVR